MRRFLMPLVAAMLVAIAPIGSASSPAVAASPGATSPAAVPPFTPPAIWDTLCDTKRPARWPLPAGTNCRWLRLDGAWRRYVVVVPPAVAADPTAAWPMVMMLHGYGGTGERMMQITDWIDVGARAGIITVFPTGWRYLFTGGKTNTGWNAYGTTSRVDMGVRLDGYPEDSPYPARDIAFLRQIVADVSGVVNVDPRRIHITGSSNGGNFMTRVAMEMSDMVASVSCSGFCDPPAESLWGDPIRAVPVLYAMGTLDDHILGRLARDMDPDPSSVPLAWAEAAPLMARFVDGWLGVWRLAGSPTRVVERATRTAATWRTPQAKGFPGAEYRLVLLLGLHHQYPWRRGDPSRPSMAAISWTFFQANPMP